MSEQLGPECAGSCDVCYDYMYGEDRFKPREERATPEDCTGLIVDGKYFPDGYDGEGYFVQVCPRQSTLGTPPSGVGFCGNGPDVIVVHSDHEPTDEQYQQIIKESPEMF